MAKQVFDTSIMEWRKRTPADDEYAAQVIAAAFPELKGA